VRRRDLHPPGAEFKLKRAGYDVQIVGDGEEAWEAIQARTPDLVVTDCQSRV